jgi:hypothetical protein
MPHHAFDGQTVGNKGRRIVVLAQQLVCFISRWFQVSLLLIQIHLHLVKSYQTASRKSTRTASNWLALDEFAQALHGHQVTNYV